MFNKSTHKSFNVETDKWTDHSCHIDVRTHIKFSKGKYNGATAVYHKHVPLGLVLGAINTYHSMDLTSDSKITAMGQAYQLKDNELVHWWDVMMGENEDA